MKKTALVSVLLSLASLTGYANPPQWACESYGLFIYSASGRCEQPYDCIRNRAYGAPSDDLKKARELALEKLVEVAHGVHVNKVIQQEILQCTQEAVVTGTSPRTISVEGWSKDFAFLLDFASYIRAKAVCKNFREDGKIELVKQPDGSTLSHAKYTCVSR